MSKYRVRCEVCGEMFSAKRSHSTYCSSRCRTRKYRYLRKAKASEPVVVDVPEVPTYDPADVPSYDIDDVPSYTAKDFEDLPTSGYVCELIETAHDKWIDGRGTDGKKIITRFGSLR